MLTGTIVRYNDEKGFGFIRVPGDDDWFFHHSSCQGFIAATGQHVTFNTSELRGRPCAVNLALVVE